MREGVVIITLPLCPPPYPGQPGRETKKRRLGGAGYGGGARPARSMRRETRSMSAEGGTGRGRAHRGSQHRHTKEPSQVAFGAVGWKRSATGLKSEKGLWDLAV